MNQTGVLYTNDTGRVVRFAITKSSTETVASARVMVRPAGSSTSVEWPVDIESQTTATVTLAHTILLGDLPTSTTYLWRAYLYGAGDVEFDSTDERELIVRPARVARP